MGVYRPHFIKVHYFEQRSEFYKFIYQTEDYGYRPFSISDFHMSKDIQPFEEKKEEEKELPKSTTFC